MPTMDNLMNNKAVMLGLAVLAFLVAAVLVIMIFRMLFGGRLRMPGGRARQARLGIVDAFDLDRQRQLIIVRRDNTEHLIMIGGPNDVVIESEIVRAEARDLRRDPGPSPTLADGRIPAPPPAFDKLEPPMPATDKPPLPRPAAEPALPSPPFAVEPQLEIAEPQRAPTFPLPLRRPTPPSPERRPVAPPKLPESVSRGDEVPALSGQPPAPAPAPPVPVPAPGVRPSQPPAVVPPPPPAAPAAPTRPSFLKPLPPRAPMRPLQRTNPPAAPSLTPSTTAPAASAPPISAPPISGPPISGPPMSPQAPASQPAAAEQTPSSRPTGKPLPPPAAPEPKDALESLEEEMAKLLGRGS